MAGIDSIFLPPGQVWIGFNDEGRSIAASIEKDKPTLRRGSAMHGCAQVLKCKVPSDGRLFGKDASEFVPA